MHMESMATTRWGDRRRADSDFAREQILDAAYRCYQRNGINKTTMEHVAREARVTRTTVYRYFQSRNDVLSGVILRAASLMADRLHNMVAHVQPFGNFVVEAALAAYEQVPRTPVLHLVLNDEGMLMHRLYVGSEDMQSITAEFLRERFEQAKAAGELREGVELPLLADWLVHIISAYLLAPPKWSTPDADLRQLLRMFVVPAVTPMNKALH